MLTNFFFQIYYISDLVPESGFGIGDSSNEADILVSSNSSVQIESSSSRLEKSSVVSAVSKDGADPVLKVRHFCGQ